MSISQPINCKVEVISKSKPSSYQDGATYRSILFIDLSKPNGSEEAKIWKSLSEEEASQLKKGQKVQLVPAGRTKDNKEKHTIVPLGPGGSQPQSQLAYAQALIDDGHISPEIKQAMATKGKELVALHHYLHKEVRQSMGNDASDDNVTAVATTVFIQLMRQYQE